jgi:hypothetical protein
MTSPTSDLGGSDQSHIAMQMASPRAGSGIVGGGEGGLVKPGGDLGKIGGDISGILHVEGAFNASICDVVGDNLGPFKFSQAPALENIQFEKADLTKSSLKDQTGIEQGHQSLFGKGSQQGG